LVGRRGAAESACVEAFEFDRASGAETESHEESVEWMRNKGLEGKILIDKWHGDGVLLGWKVMNPVWLMEGAPSSHVCVHGWAELFCVPDYSE